MSELGQLLRQTREEKGISLEEAERVTRIRHRFLEALEEGKYGDLPTLGHVHGFLRNYALHLGLDWPEVEALYTKETSSRRFFDPGIFHPKDILLAPRKSMLKADLVLGIVVVLVIIVGGGWTVWRYGQSLMVLITKFLPTPIATVAVVAKPPSTATEQIVSTATHTPELPTATSLPPTETATEVPPSPTPTATLDAPLKIATPTLRPTATPTPSLTPTPTRTQGVVVKVKVIEYTWLQVTLDGQEQPSGFLEAGQEKEWQANESIYMICGNAGGIEVTVNGQEIGVLGRRAQVVEKTWTPQSEVEQTPPDVGDRNTLVPTPTSTRALQ